MMNWTISSKNERGNGYSPHVVRRRVHGSEAMANQMDKEKVAPRQKGKSFSVTMTDCGHKSPALAARMNEVFYTTA